MRVISGKYKGKKLEGVNLIGTRPTKDRVKESMFAIINPYLFNTTCLDLFAGTGALGIEALSNGAKEAYFNELDNQTYQVLLTNLTNVKGVKTTNLDYKQAIKYYQDNNLTFDIIFLDPPYAFNYQLLLSSIVNITNKDSLIIVESEKPLVITQDFKIIKQKSYGNTSVNILKTSSE